MGHDKDHQSTLIMLPVDRVDIEVILHGNDLIPLNRQYRQQRKRLKYAPRYQRWGI